MIFTHWLGYLNTVQVTIIPLFYTWSHINSKVPGSNPTTAISLPFFLSCSFDYQYSVLPLAFFCVNSMTVVDACNPATLHYYLVTVAGKPTTRGTPMHAHTHARINADELRASNPYAQMHTHSYRHSATLPISAFSCAVPSVWKQRRHSTVYVLSPGLV